MALPAATDVVSLKFAIDGGPFCRVAAKSTIDTTLVGLALDAQPFAYAPAVAGGGATYTLSASAGSFAISGTAASLVVSRLLTASGGSYSVSGTAAGLTVSRVLTASGGSYSVSGTAASLLFNRLLTASAGAYTVTGTDAAFTYTPVVADTRPGGGIGPREYGLPYKKATPDELSRLKRALGYDSVKQVKALLARSETARAALQAFRYSDDAEALLEALLASGEYQAAEAQKAQAVDRKALEARQAAFEDEALSLLLILAALEW